MIEYLSSPVDTRFPSHWYAFADGDHFWMQWRLTVALGLAARLGLARERPLVVLDIGGGAGGFRSQLESATCWQVDLTDLNQAALETAPAARGRTLCYDVMRRDPGLCGVYDACFLFDVIEHVPDARALVAAALAHLKPGGLLVVNVPALSWLFCAYDVAAGHLRRYSKRALVAALDDPGGELASIRYWGTALVPLLAWRRVLVGSRPAANTIRAGFVPPNRLAHRALRALMRVELALPDRSPIGTSLMAAVRRAGT